MFAIFKDNKTMLCDFEGDTEAEAKKAAEDYYQDKIDSSGFYGTGLHEIELFIADDNASGGNDFGPRKEWTLLIEKVPAINERRQYGYPY